MMEWIIKYWPIIWGAGVTVWLVVLAFLNKTYARQETVVVLNSEIETLKSRLDEMPTTAELHRLNVDIVDLRGELKSLKPRLDSVQRLSDLLLENELKERIKT